MKWWTPDEAVGAHLRLLYLEDGSEDGTARDGAPGRVTVSAGAATQPAADVQLPGTGPWVYLRVEGNGPGIPEERLGAIFEPFVQVGRPSEAPGGGTGLG